MFQRHPVQNGCTMFVTTNIQERRPVFRNSAYAREAIETLYRIKEFYPFLLFGFAIMPDHCHLLLCLEAPQTISELMRKFKMGTSRNIGMGPIWQSRFHVKYPNNSQEALLYIHRNPVKAHLCDEPSDYPWSSASGKWEVQDLGW